MKALSEKGKTICSLLLAATSKPFEALDYLVEKYPVCRNTELPACLLVKRISSDRFQQPAGSIGVSKFFCTFSVLVVLPVEHGRFDEIVDEALSGYIDRYPVIMKHL